MLENEILVPVLCCSTAELTSTIFKSKPKAVSHTVSVPKVRFF